MPDGRRLAFLGIGHPLRRDDAVGVEICERLRPALAARGDVLVVSGGSAPENCVGALRAFGPERIIVIDAARMGEPPGTVRRIDPSDPLAWGASTHTLPLPLFCRYLEETLGCAVTVLGIEPFDTSFGEGLSPAVEQAVEVAVREARRQFRGRASTSPAAPRRHPEPFGCAQGKLRRRMPAGRFDALGALRLRSARLDKERSQ